MLEVLLPSQTQPVMAVTQPKQMTDPMTAVLLHSEQQDHQQLDPLQVCIWTDFQDSHQHL
jgi:hypothetical protein